MPDSRKSRVVIASVLKPVDDTRLCRKIGLSLVRAGVGEVHMFGVASPEAPPEGVVLHPFKPPRRISLRRFFIPWHIFFACLRLRPAVLVVGTHELLGVALLLKAFTRCRLLYDVQENYYWNILYTDAFPVVVRPFLALYVRTKERLAARAVDHFFLAEKGYEAELQFPPGRTTVLENKVRRPADLPQRDVPLRERPTLNLLFSGTLAESTGVFTAIDLAIKLHVIDDRFRLTLIGWSARERQLDRIRLLITARPFIKLITDTSPIPHPRIEAEIRAADFGLVTYQISPATMNAIPTKLYEYLGYRLPMLLVNHKPWVDRCVPWSAAVVFDPARYDAAELYREMMGRSFYSQPPEGVYWEDEEEALGGVVRRFE